MEKRLGYFISAGLLTILLLFCQCRNVNNMEAGEQAKYRIAPLEYPFLKSDGVEAAIDAIKVIDLEFREEALMHNIVKILTLGNGDFIVTDKKKICHFDADGKFIRNYSMRGRGPQEYAVLQDICVDNAEKTLLILDAMNKILFFSTETGEFIKSKPADWGKGGAGIPLDAILPADKGGFFIVSANTTRRSPGDEFYCLTKFDSKSKMRSRELPTLDFVYMNGLTSQSYDGRYLIKPLDTRNIVYEVREGEVKPICAIDFGDKNVEEFAAFMPDGAMFFTKLIETNRYKIPQYFAESQSHISFIAAGPKGESYGYIYSKERNDGFCLASPDHKKLPVQFLAADREYLYMVMNKYSMAGLEEFADPLTLHLVTKFGPLNAGDNQRLIGIKFK